MTQYLFYNEGRLAQYNSIKVSFVDQKLLVVILVLA